ncbi:hypothetical protein FSW04_16445 [Baekduia soli]|uniref:SCP domain-containing protein n=1 Tax=Baekduia soli TaxID=496014 RepID=A0A5B8U7C4_9ACTN|nr:CAP domain-containing protein [Baekduia soli]QEC49003.1 hypothetical protein FSW04_16445 [Baekduia soli]
MTAAISRLLPLAAAVAALAAVPAQAMASCKGANGSPTGPRAATATLCLINAQRTAHGLRKVKAEPHLAAAAGAFAQDMVARQFFDHTSPDGGTMLDRLRSAGWLPGSGSWSAGENIAWGTGSHATPASIVSGWMASPGHRANILQPAFRQIGVGIAAGVPVDGTGPGGATFVADFGARSATSGSAARSTAPVFQLRTRG